MNVTYEAVLDVEEDTVAFLAALLAGERVRRGTRAGTRALALWQQAVLVLRWFLDDARMSALARDNAISASTAYAYRDEGIAVLARQKPSLHGVLLAAKAVGHSHVIVDGTLIHTDRIATPAPRPEWTCGAAASTATTAETSKPSPPPTDGYYGRPTFGLAASTTPPPPAPTPTCCRPRRPRPAAARADPDLLEHIATWVADGRHGLADLGHEGESDLFTMPIKKPRDQDLTTDQQTYNTVHGALRCLGEPANSLLKTSYKVLHRYRGCPWRIGRIAAAALVLLHHNNDRTT